jgi:hypothetical protein
VTRRSLLVEPESVFSWRVQAEAAKHGWRWLSVTDARRLNPESKGWPDLVLAHPMSPIVHAWELKAEDGRVSTEQRAWLSDLESRELRTSVLRPSDWERIERMLEARR